MELKVQIKQAGKRENKIITAKLLLRDIPETVGELITYAAKATHSAHRKKTKQIEAFEKGDLNAVMVYTQEEIEEKSAVGRIDFGFLKSSAQVTEKEAIDTALLAFEDGLVAVFVDGRRYENVEDKLQLTGKENVTFVKLTMLSGRMW